MDEDVLLRFLSIGLIDVGGDDAKLEKLRATAGDLADSLKDAPSKSAAYALVAFDPQAPASDPVIREALDALKIRWATYVNTFSGTPIAVVRAMLLEALTRAATEDDRIGVAFVTSARNTLPFMEAGDEQAIWVSVMTAIEERVDARAEAEWATPSLITVASLTYEMPPVDSLEVKTANADTSQLAQRIRAAAGPQYHQASPSQNVPTKGNPHWPDSNAFQWVTEFGERMADAVAEAIDTVMAETKVEQLDLSAPLRAFADSIAGHVDATLKAVSGATTGLQRRTNLLWWKEALFSPSARVSYRDLPPTSAAVQMAFDLHQQVPTFSPASVSAFLFEAVLGLPSVEQRRTFAIRDLVSEAQTHGSLAAFRTAGAKLIAPPEGRGPVMALIAHPNATASRNEPEFRRLTGVPPDAPLTLPDWATWVFRELQAARATTDSVKMQQLLRKA